MFNFWFLFFGFFYIYFKFFHKKLLVLLSLELGMIFLIILNLFSSFSSFGVSSFFSSMVFLSFMVLDSVFGLCVLVSCSRNSTFFSSFFFFF